MGLPLKRISDITVMPCCATLQCQYDTAEHIALPGYALTVRSPSAHFALEWCCPFCQAVQVEVRKDGQVRRRYRAKGLTDKGPRDLVFFNEQEQREMSVLEYFERQYEIKCAHLPQPCNCMLCLGVFLSCLDQGKLTDLLRSAPLYVVVTSPF